MPFPSSCWLRFLFLFLNRIVDFFLAFSCKKLGFQWLECQLNGGKFKECFSLYDKKQKGKIKATDLIVVMRCLGASPTEPALTFPDRNAELDFSTFLNIMYRQMKQEEPEKEILTALSMIDRQKKGFITAAELRAKLTRLGEKLSEAEVDDLLKEAKVGPNGTIKYEEFVRTISLPAADY
uniref:Calmodulin like 4 n=1 Tax=Apteryx owenii TaxID=8824 RepID=A0A8B9S701_APTOW